MISAQNSVGTMLTGKTVACPFLKVLAPEINDEPEAFFAPSLLPFSLHTEIVSLHTVSGYNHIQHN